MLARQESARCDNTRKKVKSLHDTKIKQRYVSQMLSVAWRVTETGLINAVF